MAGVKIAFNDQRPHRDVVLSPRLCRQKHSRKLPPSLHFLDGSVSDIAFFAS